MARSFMLCAGNAQLQPPGKYHSPAKVHRCCCGLRSTDLFCESSHSMTAVLTLSQHAEVEHGGDILNSFLEQEFFAVPAEG